MEVIVYQYSPSLRLGSITDIDQFSNYVGLICFLPHFVSFPVPVSAHTFFEEMLAEIKQEHIDFGEFQGYFCHVYDRAAVYIGLAFEHQNDAIEAKIRFGG